MEHYTWVAPLAVALLNLALTGKLLTLKDAILKEVRDEFATRESCTLRHVAVAEALSRLECARCKTGAD